MIPRAEATKRKGKITEMKNSFDRFISRLYMVEQEDISESSKTERKENKN